MISLFDAADAADGGNSDANSSVVNVISLSLTEKAKCVCFQYLYFAFPVESMLCIHISHIVSSPIGDDPARPG